MGGPAYGGRETRHPGSPRVRAAVIGAAGAGGAGRRAESRWGALSEKESDPLRGECQELGAALWNMTETRP